MNVPAPDDPLFGPIVVTLAMTGTCALAAIGVALANLATWLSERKAKRERRRHYDETYEPEGMRARNLVSLRDWKHREPAAKRLREVA